MKMLTILAAFNPGGDGGWIFDLFKSIRMSSINMSSVSVSLAMAVASIIVVFKLVLVSKNLMSDEQGSGFGQIKMWSVIRPIVILIMISSTPQCLGVLDDVANSISISVTNSVTKKDIKAGFGTAAAIMAEEMKEETGFDVVAVEEADARLDANALAADRQINSGGVTSVTGGQYVGMDGLTALWNHLFHTNRNNAIDDAIENMNQKKIEEGKQEMTKPEKEIATKAMKDFYAAHSSITTDDEHMFDIGNGMFFPGICVMIYDLLFKVIQCFAELALCVLAVLAPWVMVFALFDSNQGAIINYGLRYIQISFWKVIAAVINFAVVTAAYANLEYQARQALDSLNRTGEKMGAHIGGGITITAIMCIAGIFALLKVSDMAQAIIPTTGGSFGDLGGAGAGFAAGLGKSAASIPGKAATTATGISGKAASKAGQKATQQFQQGVTDALGKIGKQVSSMGKDPMSDTMWGE